MPLAIGYVLRGKCDFTGENVLIAAARPSRLRAEHRAGELLAEIAKRGERHSGPRIVSFDHLVGAGETSYGAGNNASVLPISR
jgi:hypothetical protein